MSILDQVRKNQFQKSFDQFNPVETLNTLFSRLSDKERDIVERRYGLGIYDYQTLENIGNQYGITRERVRQIENLSIKKLKEIQELRNEIKEAERVVGQLLEQYGGVMEEAHFLENLLHYIETHEKSSSSLLFLAEYIFSDNISKIKQDKEFNNLWKLGATDISLLKEVVNEMIRLVEDNKNPISLEQLLSKFKQSEFFQNNKTNILSAINYLEVQEEDVDKILESYLRSSRKIRQDLFDNWGLISWGTVQPKKINDKIYLVLKKQGKPMHFTKIAQVINDEKFDEKIAYPATVHNELILDKKYVLVGRGIYALKEWGYQSGTVSDVVVGLLKDNGPLTKEAIIEKVLEKRQVKKSTIYLSLMNSENIIKNKEGKYQFSNATSGQAENSAGDSAADIDA